MEMNSNPEANMENKQEEEYGWHITSRDGTTQHLKEKEEVGKTYTVEGTIIPCKNGLHGSINPVDALYYASGTWVKYCRYSGTITHHVDKLAASERTVLAEGDAANVFVEFAAACSERAKGYAAEYAANAAAESAAKSAAKYAKYAAESAAKYAKYAANAAANAAAKYAKYAAESAEYAAESAEYAANAAKSAAKSAANAAEYAAVEQRTQQEDLTRRLKMFLNIRAEGGGNVRE